MHHQTSRLYLHIGAPKTGTTYLQTTLEATAPELREDGCLYPGSKAAQQEATRDLLGVGAAPAKERRAGAWSAMLEQISSWPGTVVFSNETLALGLGPRRIDRLLRHVTSHEIHVVFTARDLVRQLPAAWQEALKNRATTSWADFTSRLAHEQPLGRTLPGDRIWRAQDASTVLEPWAARLGADHVHVVTVPPRGAPRELLLERFGRAIGTQLRPTVEQRPQPNVSLGAAEATLLRHLNSALAESDHALPWPSYVRLVKRLLANDVLPRRAGGRPIWLTPAQLRWAATESARMAASLSEAGYDIVGDLRDLTPDEPGVPVDDADVDGYGEEHLCEVAVWALAETLTTRA